MPVTEELRELLLEILTETERLDKVHVSIDPVSRSVTIIYEDLDSEWFQEVDEATRPTSAEPAQPEHDRT